MPLKASPHITYNTVLVLSAWSLTWDERESTLSTDFKQSITVGGLILVRLQSSIVRAVHTLPILSPAR